MIFYNKYNIKKTLSILLFACVSVTTGCQKGEENSPPPASSGSISGPTQLIIPETGTQAVFITNSTPNAAVNISAQNLPAGVTSTSCTAQPSSSCSFNLISNNATPGTTGIQISGMDTNVLSVKLTVSSSPITKANIAASTNTINLKSPDSTVITLTNSSSVIAQGVRVNNLPAGVSASGCASIPGPGLCQLKFISNNALPGTNQITISGENTNSVPATLTISPVQISADSPISLLVGGTVNVAIKDEDTAVLAENLSATHLPHGVTVGEDCSAQPSASCQLTLSADMSATPGNTQITLAGSNTISLQPNLIVSVAPPATTTISAPAVTLSSSGENTLEVSNTGTATATGINVVASSLPSGVTASPSAGCAALPANNISLFKKTGIWLKSGKLSPSASLSCELTFNSNGAAPGTTAISIAGTNTNTAVTNLTISPLNISGPSSINIAAGSTTPVIVHNEDPAVAAENITLKNLPNGVSVGNSCTAQPLNSCTLNLSATSAASAGTTAITIEGTNTESISSQLVVTALPGATISAPLDIPMLTTGTATIEIKNLSSIATQSINVTHLPANVTVTQGCASIAPYSTCGLILTSSNAAVTSTPVIVNIAAANTNIASASLTLNTNDIPTITGYMPVGFIDGSQIADPSKVFISIKGFNASSNLSCYVTFNSQGLGQCTPLGPNLSYMNLGTPLTQFPQTATGKYYMYLPPMISGRIYISMGQGLEFNIAPAVNPITGITQLLLQDPLGFNQRDPTYNVLYDKVEFTYTQDGAYFNPTAVDFFAIPLQLTMLSNATYSGLTDKRSDILAKAETAFTASNVSSQWSKLFLSYNYHNVNTVLRVESPSKAITTGTPQFYENPFDEAYLTDLNANQNREDVFINTNGESYVDNVWNYYKNHTIEVTDPDEIQGAPMPTFTGQVDNNDNFVFRDNANPTITFSMPKPTLSGTLFGGIGLDNGAPPNNTYGAIITRNFTSAFDAGLLPGDQLVLSKATFRQMNAEQKYYLNNPNWYGPKQAPWYDLYSQVFHSFQDQNIYTFAYDDELAQDGTLTETGAAPMPLLINIGNMSGTTLPPPPDSDNATYNVTLVIPAGAVIINLANNQVLQDNQVIASKSPLAVSILGTPEKIYFAPPLILPELDSIGITPTSSTDMTVTFPSQNILGLAAGWTSANGCGVSLNNLNPNDGISTPLKLDANQSSCIITLSGLVSNPQGPAINAQLTLNYTSGLKILSPLVCENLSSHTNCKTAISADANNNIGIPPPSAM